MNLNRKLRIGMVTPALYWGGAERVLVNLGRELKDAVDWTGCALCCSAYRERNMCEEMRQYMPVYPPDQSSPLATYGYRACKEVSRDADAIVCWGEVDLAMTLVNYDKPIVFVTHGCGAWDGIAIDKAKASDKVTHWVCVSSACLPLLHSKGIENVTVIENGVEPERCTVTRSREEVRAELGLQPNDFAVGYLGRMAMEKAPERIAYAIAALPNDVKGVWIGGGYHAPQLQGLITWLLNSRAIIKDTVWQIGDYLQAFDVFTLVSPAEGFSMAFLEACLVGVPCIMTPVGVMPDLVRRHGNLWMTVEKEHTPHDLAMAIAAMRLNYKSWKQTARVAKHVVTTNYLACHMAKRWLKYLEEITAL